MTLRKKISLLAPLLGMLVGTTAWADTFMLTNKTPITMVKPAATTVVPFAYIPAVEQGLVKLAVKSYNNGTEEAEGCHYIDHLGHPYYMCEGLGVMCWAGWVQGSDGGWVFDVGCAASPDPE